ncbi:MAG: type II toxin-antitoxin system VapC family toxin [Alphaproteobacteria bacterium]|nr:type II toxin-antitoxin system VapC family toxin [Alphaproteobacteria bacterium]MCB9794557.1 type II toxin-antitoxin system VapC family toxin [Alphaproteobacteria bacterium]
MSWLLDTNVLSELRKGERGAPAVRRWLAEHAHEEHYLSVLVLGELRRGVELKRRKDPAAGAQLDAWVTRLELDFAARILPVDAAVADRWGHLNVPDPVPAVDGLIAATALVHDLVVVTRNVKDLARTGARVLNPFEA